MSPTVGMVQGIWNSDCCLPRKLPGARTTAVPSVRVSRAESLASITTRSPVAVPLLTSQPLTGRYSTSQRWREGNSIRLNQNCGCWVEPDTPNNCGNCDQSDELPAMR